MLEHGNNYDKQIIITIKTNLNFPSATQEPGLSPEVYTCEFYSTHHRISCYMNIPRCLLPIFLHVRVGAVLFADAPVKQVILIP